MKRLYTLLKSLLLIPLGILLTFLATVALDRALPLVKHIPPEAYGFAPINGQSVVLRKKSCDFDHVARINSLGLRGREVSLEKGDAFRIAVIGSSYVYGWGVNDDQCWVSLLEQKLRQDGLSVEVINLGRNGGNVGQYTALAYEAIPLFRPDMVIVGLGQGIDISWTGPMPREERIRLLLKIVYPNTMALLRGPRIAPAMVGLAETMPVPPLEEGAKEAPRQFARETYEKLRPDQKERFDRLEPKVKEVFFSGEVNPGIVDMAMKAPSTYASPLNLNDKWILEKRKYLTGYLREISRLCRWYKADFIVVSTPFCAYVSQKGHEDYLRMGFEDVEGMSSASSPDEPLRLACEAVRVPFVTVTDRFRQESANRNLFFEFDLHLSAEGNALFADCVAPFVRERIRGRTGK